MYAAYVMVDEINYLSMSEMYFDYDNWNLRKRKIQSLTW